MVAMSTSLAYRSFELDSIATVRTRKLTSMGNQAKLLQRSETSVGWISRNKSRLRSRQNFFLDIPFYRTH